MGCNAALLTKKVLENTYQVLTVQLMALLQAVDYLKCSDRMSAKTLAVYQAARKIFPVFVEDQPKYRDLIALREFLEKDAI